MVAARWPGPKSPCEICGRPVTSKYGVCRETTDCRRAYHRREYSARKVRQGKQVAAWVPCEVCGGLTTSKYGVCKRNPECAREQNWRCHHPDRFVYAIFFPESKILKVGTGQHHASVKCGAQSKMRNLELPYADAMEIWSMAGYLREESYIQSVLSFQLCPIFQAKSKLSEWFDTRMLSSQDLISILDEIALTIPTQKY